MSSDFHKHARTADLRLESSASMFGGSMYDTSLTPPCTGLMTDFAYPVA